MLGFHGFCGLNNPWHHLWKMSSWVGNPGRPPYVIPHGSARLKKMIEFTGQNWREQRGFFVNQMKHNSGCTVDDIVMEEADTLAEIMERIVAADSGSKWLQAAERKRSAEKRSKLGLFNMHQFFMPVTVNVIWKLSTGHRVNWP